MMKFSFKLSTISLYHNCPCLQVPKSSCKYKIPSDDLGASHPTISPQASYHTFRNSWSVSGCTRHNLSCNTQAASKSQTRHHCVLNKCDNRTHGYGPSSL